MAEISVEKTEWDLNPLFESDDDPSMPEKRKIWKEAVDSFVNKWKDRDDYLEKPEVLAEALNDYENLGESHGTEGDEAYYFWLRTQQDQNDPKLKAKFNKVEEFAKEIANSLQFFSLRIAKIPKEKQGEFLEHEGLKDYRHYLESSFLNAKYLLSELEEKIMTLKSSSAYSSWVKMVSGFIAKEEREVLDEDGSKKAKTFSDLLSLISSRKKEVRDGSAKAVNEILEKYVEVAEAELNAILADKKVNDELRGFERPDKGRHMGDDIDTEVVDALVEAVLDRIDIARKYYGLKAKLLGLPKLEYHERNIEYGKIDKKYSYEDSVDLIYKVFFDLDEKFAEIFKKMIENGQIDVYPRKGKNGGAFCVHFLKSQPTYVLLNHADKLNDVETLAHEMGHAINNEMMKEKQSSINFDTVLSTAEVASTFMEDFVLEELRKEADDELKLALMVQKLNGDVSSIMRQVSCYAFEKDLHKEFGEKGHLSKEDIGSLFQKYMSNYMGDFVEQSPGSENWWVYWGHIRRFFYNYSYASGLLISKALQNEVKKDKKFTEKVKEFLSAGTSDSPKNIFMKMGIDITDKEFWNKGLDEVENLLNESEELAKRLGKI